MNRRELLLALGLAACGTPPRTPRRPPRMPPGPTDAGPPVACASCTGIPISPQTRPSPLAFQGDVLVQRTDDELRFWNALTMKRIDALPIPTRGFCVLQDGTIGAFVERPGATNGELHHIDAARAIEILSGPVFMAGDQTHVLRGAAANEIYVSELKDQVVLFRLGKTTLEPRARIKVDIAAWNTLDQLTSFGDGRLLSRDGQALRVLEPGKPDVRHETRDQFAVHLAAASNGRFWYSYATKTTPAQTLVLARITERLVADTRIDLGPGRVVHLAAHPGAAVVLVHTDRAVNDVAWSVVVITEDGAERWRVDVPADVGARSDRLDHGFVAISERRVALSAGADVLLAWDASTGKRV